MVLIATIGEPSRAIDRLIVLGEFLRIRRLALNVDGSLITKLNLSLLSTHHGSDDTILQFGDLFGSQNWVEYRTNLSLVHDCRPSFCGKSYTHQNGQKSCLRVLETTSTL